MTAEELKRRIEAGLPGATVLVSTPDETHFEAVVVAQQFAGRRAVQRHQLVYSALGAVVGREVHALSLAVHTPEEWAALPKSGAGSGR